MNSAMKFPLVIKLRLILPWIILAFSILIPGFASSSEFPKPIPGSYVNDYIGWLDKEDVNRLNDKLAGISQSTTVEIAVIITDDLLGYEPNDYCTRLGVEWGVGKSSTDNGVVILVKPTGSQGERKAYIATGYGVEALIPDATAHRIVNREMVPMFKADQRYEGLERAANVIMELVQEEYTAEDYGQAPRVPLALIYILIFILVSVVSPMIAVWRYASVHNIGFWAALALLNTSGGKGSYRDFRGGSGPFFGGSSFGGGSGGGFGGFGGGSFGGGGAGGSW